MAKVKLFKPFDMFSGEIWWGNVKTANGSTIRIQDGSHVGIYKGDFSYEGSAVRGVVRAYEERMGNKKLVSVTGIDKDAAKIYRAVQLEADFDKAAKLTLSGNDKLVGSNGDDGLRGFAGRDVLKGKKGDDELAGNGGKDKLFGGAGDDTLNGGAGNDTLNGGAGSDTFVFDTRKGVDTIKDFRANDRIEIESSAFGDATEDDIRIARAGGVDSIFVDGDLVARVTGHDVTLDDFIFS